MNPRRHDREKLGMTQVDAAARAGVSLATWRRWEDEPDSVSAATRASCERVLDQDAKFRTAIAERASNFERAWRESPVLTPRQASAIAMTLDWWADTNIAEWLRGAGDPLHEIPPFDQLDLRVMMLVSESRAWVAAARARCTAVAKELELGKTPFERPGCYFDELLMALALSPAQTRLSEMPELFEELAPRDRAFSDDLGEDESGLGDDDWDMVSDGFDDLCRWDEWEVPLFNGHPLLRAILAERHPYTWFDDVPASGPGYSNRLAGLEPVSQPE